VTIAETLLSRQVRVCGTITVNRGLPPEMKNESQSLKRGETTFRRKVEILLQSWRDTHVVNMISTVHDSTMVDVPRRNEEVKKKHTCIFKYNMFMKGVEKNSEVAKESCILAYKLCTFQFFSNLSKTKPYITNEILRISATSGKRLGYR